MPNPEAWGQQAEGKSLEEILSIRDEYETNSEEWAFFNEKKAELLEQKKPSTAEEIVYFDETQLWQIPEGFVPVEKLPTLTTKTARRSLLEYNPEQRHPIPYCIVRYRKHYFFIFRESGSGEMRLIGKKGLLGGHVGAEDVDQLSLSKTILNGLKRELEEEANITDDIVQHIQLHGLIKSNDGVDADHLGIIYEIEINTKHIQSEEEGVLVGGWIHERELAEHYDSFESWAKLVYDHILKPHIADLQ